VLNFLKELRIRAQQKENNEKKDLSLLVERKLTSF